MIWVLVPLLALTIPLVAIISNVVVKPWFELRQRQLELTSAIAAEKAAQYAAHTERLEQRVCVLERIVTDRGVELDHQIERLRDAPPLN